MTIWTPNPTRAHFDARHEPRLLSNAPHHLRCDFYLDDQRCALAEGHPGEHQVPKERA